MIRHFDLPIGFRRFPQGGAHPKDAVSDAPAIEGAESFITTLQSSVFSHGIATSSARAI